MAGRQAGCGPAGQHVGEVPGHARSSIFDGHRDIEGSILCLTRAGGAVSGRGAFVACEGRSPGGPGLPPPLQLEELTHQRSLTSPLSGVCLSEAVPVQSFRRAFRALERGAFGSQEGGPPVPVRCPLSLEEGEGCSRGCHGRGWAREEGPRVPQGPSGLGGGPRGCRGPRAGPHRCPWPPAAHFLWPRSAGLWALPRRLVGAGRGSGGLGTVVVLSPWFTPCSSVHLPRGRGAASGAAGPVAFVATHLLFNRHRPLASVTLTAPSPH